MKKSIFTAMMAASMLWPSAAAWARDEHKQTCELALSAGIGLEEAYRIIGPAELGDTKYQVANAVNFVAGLKGATAEKKVETLGKLLEAIRRLQLFTWDYKPFKYAFGSKGFYGENGQFILIAINGDIFRGKLDPQEIHDEVLVAPYQQIREVKAK